MSHTTTIDNVEITDVVALKAAISELQQNGVDCALLENALPRGYYRQQSGLEAAPFVLNLKKSKYDVGFYQKKDGASYEARCDLFSGDIARQLGADGKPLGKLMNLYAVNAITRKAVQQGYSVNRTNKEDGSVQLQVTTR